MLKLKTNIPSLKNLIKTAVYTVFISVIALSVVFVLFYPYIFTFSIPKLPDVPIDLSKAGSIAETDITIEQNDQFFLYLTFYVNDKPNHRNQLFDLLDNTPHMQEKTKPSVPIPINLQIEKYEKTSNRMMLYKVYMTDGISGHNDTFINREIDYLRINSGKYHVRIKNLKAFPELTDTRVELQINYASPFF